MLLAFPLAHRDGPRTVSLDLGHFLANVAGLAKWTAGPVEWAGPIAEMVRRAVGDGGRLDELLKGQAPRSDIDRAQLEATSDWGWSADLTDFQIDNLQRLSGMEHGSNFSVPGAGKTRVTLAAFATMKADGTVKRMLVVAPKSAHGSWVDEAAQVFSSSPSIGIVDSDRLQSADILLVNYERLPALRNTIADYLMAAPTLLVLDEAHRMKRGPEGAYGSALLSLGPLARKRMILSGTPAPNGPEDLQSLLEFVWPGRGARLVASAQRQPGLLKPAFVRTTKSDLGLPKVIPTISHVTLPPLHRAIYDALLGQFSTLPESERVDELGKV
ncbi:MAG: putative DNA-binding protein, partial [Schumannella sp.]|nr:putative DNA-binding protein [Schumannella sp.]